MTQPTLIVVAGPPGAGKTTLAHALARELHCPALCRDELREGLVLTHGSDLAPDINTHVSETFFATLALLLERQISLVAEAAFQHRIWAPRLAPLHQIARVQLVICTLDPALARARAAARGSADPTRALLHGNRDPAAGPLGVELPTATWEPPQLDVPTLHVDTTTGYDPDIAAIAAWVRGRNET